jgi:hypothetical protein
MLYDILITYKLYVSVLRAVNAFLTSGVFFCKDVMWSTGRELARGDGYPQKRCIRGKDDHRWGFRITKFSSRSREYRRRRLLLEREYYVR